MKLPPGDDKQLQQADKALQSSTKSIACKRGGVVDGLENDLQTWWS